MVTSASALAARWKSAEGFVIGDAGTDGPEQRHEPGLEDAFVSQVTDAPPT
jgi:hypothetical protein